MQKNPIMNEVVFTQEELVIARRDKEIVIHAPYFNAKLEAVDRVIRYRNSHRTSLVVEENGKPVCGMSGKAATERLKQFLLTNIF